MEEEGSKGERESPFMQDKDGNWIVNPKGRETGVELMTLDARRRAQERGEAIDPLEALGQAAERLKVYRDTLSGGATALPTWMTDPAEFIRTIRTISPEPKADEGLKEQITALTNTVNDLKEERYREQITTQHQQIQALTNKVGELADTVTDLRRPVTGRTELDIIHEVASEGIGLAKTAEEKEARKGRYRAAIETNKKIEEIGKRLFFGEKTAPETPEEVAPAPEPESKPPSIVPLVYE